MNLKETAQIIAMISVIFPKIADGGQLTTSVWASVLKDLPFEEVRVATIKVLAESEFEPKPATIRKAVEQIRQHNNRELSGEEAWEEVLNNLNPYIKHQWSTKKVERAVRIVGYMNIVESTNISFERNSFIKTYNSLSERESEDKKIETALNLANKETKNLLGISLPKLTKNVSNGKVGRN